MTRNVKHLFSLGAGLLLSGCLGQLLGGGKPDQLYRFGVPTATERVDAGGATDTRTLVMPLPIFPPELSADRILTSQGRELSYIKDTRWVTSGPALYESAVESAVRSRGGITFLGRKPVRPADGELQIVIDRFEAMYGNDPKAAPIIHVEGRASLLLYGGTVPMIHRIYGEQQATANSASAIVAGFDSAVRQSNDDLAQWVYATLPRTTVAGPITR